MSQSNFKKQLPNFTQVEPSHIKSTIEALLDKNRIRLNQLLAQSKPFEWGNLMQPLEEMSDELSKAWSPISHLHSVLETDALRKAYNETLPLLSAYHTELAQNEALFNAILEIQKNPDVEKRNPAQQTILKNDIRDFKLAGIHLPQHQKKQAGDLQNKLSQLATKFAENVLDATHGWTLHLKEMSELTGLPTQALTSAKEQAEKRKLPGYLITLDYPSYSTAIKFLDKRELRKTLYEAYVTRASDQGPLAGKWDNTPVIEQLLKLRHEFANLVGFQHYADYSLATKMAKTPEDVLHFLQDLLARSKPVAEKEYQDILEFAKTKDGLHSLEAFDIPYYSEKLRESQFHFTQEDLRPYFPIEKVLQGMFDLVHKLYGLNIQKEEGIDIWNKEVQFFSIHDKNKALRGGFYIDLYARSQKRDGAWMDEACARRSLTQDHLQYPVAYLTCNFMPPLLNQVALLTHDDVLTLFHEFGHCLHHMLTKVDYPSVAGINGVPWDAVEFPSQFMENYCWEKESLDMISAHYETNEKIPTELFKKMIQAKNFQTGLQMVRQIEFSLFDFRLHLEYDETIPNFTQRILDQVRTETSVIPVPSFNRFQHSFSHIFGGGYAAGYYSYKWAEVLSSDAYAQFEEKGIFDPETGQSFLHNILEVGGVRDPMLSFIAFRGRKPTIDALLRHNGLASS